MVRDRFFECSVLALCFALYLEPTMFKSMFHHAVTKCLIPDISQEVKLSQ